MIRRPLNGDKPTVLTNSAMSQLGAVFRPSLFAKRKDRFALYISEVVIEEAGRGDNLAAKKRLAKLSGIEILPLNDDVVVLSKALIQEGGVPKKALDDALHIAVATVHRIDYLLTWNCRHITTLK